jgi:hypothetical protein
MYHILKRPGPSEDSGDLAVVAKEYASREGALEAAKALCRLHQWSLLVVQDMDEVQMAAVVVQSYAPPPPPAPVQRSSLEVLAAHNAEALLEDGPPRAPQARPKLLILNRRATPDELMGHLIVVAEGRIVKNAFGGFTHDDILDMPITAEERLAVVNALGAGK